MRYLSLVCLLVVSAMPALAAWGTCRGAVAPAVAPVYSWQANPTRPGVEWALYYGYRQVGAWNIDYGVFRPYDAASNSWGDPCAAPIHPPAEAKKAAVNPPCGCAEDCCCEKGKCRCNPADHCDSDDCGCNIAGALIRNFGVDQSKISKVETCTINGKAATCRAAKRAITKGGDVPDDSAKLSLTLVGSEEDCAKALADLPLNDQLREHCIVQCYRPDDVMVSAKYWGGPTLGNPVVFLEQPDGTPLWSEVRYRGKETWDAVRKADPNFKPDKVPGPNNQPTPAPAPAPAPATEFKLPPGVPVVALGAVGLIALALFRKQ